MSSAIREHLHRRALADSPAPDSLSRVAGVLHARTQGLCSLHTSNKGPHGATDRYRLLLLRLGEPTVSHRHEIDAVTRSVVGVLRGRETRARAPSRLRRFHRLPRAEPRSSRAPLPATLMQSPCGLIAAIRYARQPLAKALLTRGHSTHANTCTSKLDSGSTAIPGSSRSDLDTTSGLPGQGEGRLPWSVLKCSRRRRTLCDDERNSRLAVRSPRRASVGDDGGSVRGNTVCSRCGRLRHAGDGTAPDIGDGVGSGGGGDGFAAAAAAASAPPARRLEGEGTHEETARVPSSKTPAQGGGDSRAPQALRESPNPSKGRRSRPEGALTETEAAAPPRRRRLGGERCAQSSCFACSVGGTKRRRLRTLLEEPQCAPAAAKSNTAPGVVRSLPRAA